MTESFEISIGEFEGRKIEGHLVGMMSPLMRLYRTCQTRVSLGRELMVGEIFSGLREGGWSLLITDSLAYGMSIPASDIDFELIDIKESSGVIKAFSRRLARRLPGMEFHFLESHDLEEIEKMVSFLEENPNAGEDDVMTACGRKAVVVSDFLDIMTVGGLLLGDESKVVSLWQRAKRLTKASSLLDTERFFRELVLGNYRELRKDKYLRRLKESEEFRQLDGKAQEALLVKIEETENRLEQGLF